MGVLDDLFGMMNTMNKPGMPQAGPAGAASPVASLGASAVGQATGVPQTALPVSPIKKGLAGLMSMQAPWGAAGQSVGNSAMQGASGLGKGLLSLFGM